MWTRVDAVCAAALALVVLCACGDETATDESATVETEGPSSKEEAAVSTHEGKADWTIDWCERYGWYNDGACDWFCPKRDPDCDLPPLGPEPDGVATKLPVVLAHGFDGSPDNRWGWYGVAEALAADGHEVYVATVPPYQAPEVRAQYLAAEVDAALYMYDAEQVNIVAHSMGGLDSRHLIAGLGYGDKVASLTTISSPHRGTRVADVALGIIPGFADDVINALARAWGLTYSDLADDTDLRAAFEALAEANADKWNEDNPDDPRVYYQSWAGVSSVFGIKNGKDIEACEGEILSHDKGGADRMDATLVPMAAFTAHGTKLLPNDGMATVESAKHGNFRGCIPADHLDEVGQVKDEGPDRHTGFDHVRFYRNVAFELADMGF